MNKKNFIRSVPEADLCGIVKGKLYYFSHISRIVYTGEAHVRELVIRVKPHRVGGFGAFKAIFYYATVSNKSVKASFNITGLPANSTDNIEEVDGAIFDIHADIEYMLQEMRKQPLPGCDEEAKEELKESLTRAFDCVSIKFLDALICELYREEGSD